MQYLELSPAEPETVFMRSKARCVGHGQQARPLGLGEGMARQRAHGLRPAIATDEAIRGSPALKGVQIDAGNLAGWL